MVARCLDHQVPDGADHRAHGRGVPPEQHEVGDLHVSYDVLEMPGEHGLSITTYSAEEGSPTAEKFKLLASWAAQPDPTRPTVQ